MSAPIMTLTADELRTVVGGTNDLDEIIAGVNYRVERHEENVNEILHHKN